MSELIEGLRAAGEVAKAAPSWLDNALSTLDKFNLLPMTELRKKNALDKVALQRQLDEQNHAHKRAMDLADAQTRAAIACMEVAPHLALNAAEKALSEGASLQHAYQNNLPMAVRATNQLYMETLQGQYAKERIALYALKEAAENPDAPVAEGETSETFYARFWEYAKGIRDEDAMQQWGKLLANEMRQPGSFSVRTLDILRSMDSEQAKLFKHISKYVVNTMLILMDNVNDIRMSFYDFSQLAAIGLLIKNARKPLSRGEDFFINKHFLIKFNTDDSIVIDNPCSVLTKEGRELYNIVSLSIDESAHGIDYVDHVLKNKWRRTTQIVSRYQA